MFENQEIKRQNIANDYKRDLLSCEICGVKDQIGIIYSSCNHSICFNCVYKFFLSSGFKGLDIESIKSICPLCKNGEKEISLDDFSQYLQILVTSKDEINFQTEDINRNTDEINYENHCRTHKNRKLVKLCKNCGINLCDMCINELHERNYPNHELVDIQQEINNNSKNQSNKNINEKVNKIYETISKNTELKELQENQKSFLEKLESEKIKFNIEIDKILNDLKSLRDNYSKKYFEFQTNIEKIFEIINFSYLNYHISSPEDKNQISITKKLLDINYVSKKLDFTEINTQLKRSLSEIMFDTNYFSYEFQWSTFEFKKSFKLLSQEENKGEDCVTKIIELEDLNKIVAGLIGGQIYIWNLDEKSKEKEINAHKSAIWAMIKLSNNMIASGSSDKTIKIWNIDDFDKPIVLKGHAGTIFCLGELEKYKIISGSEDRTIKQLSSNMVNPFIYTSLSYFEYLHSNTSSKD